MAGKEKGRMTDRETLGESMDERYGRYRQIIRDFTLMSDTFMRNVCREKDCVEHILQVIMGQVGLRVVESVVQSDYKNMQGRSAILDCVARDTEERRYNMEVQQKSEGAAPERARYHGGLLDMHTLKEGQDFRELPEGNIIFITRSDVLGKGLPIYHIDRTVDETGEKFRDGQHILYVNAAIQDEGTELGRLMHDFHCRDADEMYSEVLAARVRQLKETTKGVESMCQEMDQIYKEGKELGEQIGEERGRRLGEEHGRQIGEELGKVAARRQTVLSMAIEGLPVELIARIVKESTDKVRQWIDEGAAAAR